MPRSVRGLDQPAQRLVAAEQRVDAVERAGVVAVVGAGLEDRGEVEQGHPQLLEVVEVLDDTVQRAAVQLERHVGPAVHDGVVPVGRLRPARQWRAGRGACEPVGEDLVAHLVRHPVGQPVLGADLEVPGVGHVAVVHAGGVEPAVAGAGVAHHEPVRRQRVHQSQVRLPPRTGLVGARARGLDHRRLPVADRAQHHVLRRGVAVLVVRHPDPQPDRAPERAAALRRVEGRAVVVRVPPGLEGVRCAAHPFTPPAVMPPTMKRWR